MLVPLFVALLQFLPPIPRRIEGDTALTRRAPIPLPAENQSWIRVESPRFTIISSANERRTREVAESLEALAASLRQVNERFDGSTIDTQVLLFARRRDSQALFDLLLDRRQAEAPGVFVAHGDGSGTMIIDAGREWNRTIFHELIHNLLSASGARLPLWLEEGIAEYFSTAEFRGRSIVLGRPIREHQRQLWRTSNLPLRDVLTAPRNSPLITHLAFYPSCWAIVEWMMRMNRQAFYRLLADIESGTPSLVAIRKHYSVDASTIERSFRKVQGTPAAVIRVRVEPLAGATAMNAISRAEVLREIGSFLSKLEVTAPDAERYFAAAMEIEPQNARAIAAMATLRARQKEYEKAFPLYEKALAAGPDDPHVLLSFAEALMKNLIGQFAGVLPIGRDASPRVRRARELAVRALERGADPASANAIIGASYLIEDDVTPGIAPLEQSLERRPGRNDVALNLYALYLRSGNRARADALFERRFAHAVDPQVTFAARSLFVQQQLTAVNALIHRNDLEKAQVLMKELIDLTTDPVAKIDLQIQLRRLQETAVVNAHISRYNEAIALANHGDAKGALKMIEELLKVAKDETVVSDATHLKEALEWRIRRARK